MRKSPPLPSNTPIRPPTTLCSSLLPLPRRCGSQVARVVLPVDPVSHQHRCRHQHLEHAAVGVVGSVVVVQEDTALQHCPQATGAGRDEEGCVADQAPLGSGLRTVVGAAAECVEQVAIRQSGVEPERHGALPTHLVASLREHRLQPGPACVCRGVEKVQIEAPDFVGRGVVKCGDEDDIDRHRDATRPQIRLNLRLVEQQRQCTGIDLAGLAGTGATVQRSGLCIVRALAAVSDQHHEPREATVEAHGVKHAHGEVRLPGEIQARQHGAACRTETWPEAGAVD